MQSLDGQPVCTNSILVRFEVFKALTMKNSVFWDIKTQFVPQRKHITFLLQNQPVNVM
jgi:hypothetical protein